jgi:hypothetical protein
MGTLTAPEPMVCNPGAIIGTMARGVLVGVVSAVVLTVASHAYSAVTEPEVATPVLGLELYVGTLLGLLLSVSAVAGAAVALVVVDRRLRWNRFAQGGVAGVGAALAGWGVFASLGPTIVVSGTGMGTLAFSAAAAFGVMVLRARTHTVPAHGRTPLDMCLLP